MDPIVWEGRSQKEKQKDVAAKLVRDVTRKFAFSDLSVGSMVVSLVNKTSPLLDLRPFVVSASEVPDLPLVVLVQVVELLHEHQGREGQASCTHPPGSP